MVTKIDYWLHLIHFFMWLKKLGSYAGDGLNIWPERDHGLFFSSPTFESLLWPYA